MLSWIQNFSLSVVEFDLSDSITKALIDFDKETPTLHPYGFYIWKLHATIEDFDLRLHVWLSEFRRRQKPDWPPHSHNSDLYSLVLCGSVTNLVWDWESSDAGNQIVYEVSYQENQSKLRSFIGPRIPYQ